jgi:hypothetical protein
MAEASGNGASPENSEEVFRRVEERAGELFGDWLYPNARLRGGGHPEDLTGFGHLQYQTDDSVQQVRTYYWQKIMPERPLLEGSIYKMSGDKPWFFVRSAYPTGGSWMGAYVTDERSLSIVAAAETQEGNVKLFYTWEDHQGKRRSQKNR